MLDANSLEKVNHQIKLFLNEKTRKHTQQAIARRIKNKFSNKNMIESYRNIYLGEHHEN